MDSTEELNRLKPIHVHSWIPLDVIQNNTLKETWPSHFNLFETSAKLMRKGSFFLTFFRESRMTSWIGKNMSLEANAIQWPSRQNAPRASGQI